MNRRKFIAAVAAVCAFPAALFARSKPIHRFHRGSLSGTFRPEELQPKMLADFEGFRAVDLGWSSFPNLRWIGLDLPVCNPNGFHKSSVFVPREWWIENSSTVKAVAFLALMKSLARNPSNRDVEPWEHSSVKIISRWHDHYGTYSGADLNHLNKTFGDFYEKHPNLGAKNA